jgi:hypothetical protein
LPVPRRGFHDRRIAGGPVIAVAIEQPNSSALALDDQAIAVMLDFVNPVRAGRNLSSARWDTRFEGIFGMAECRKCEPIGATLMCDDVSYCSSLVLDNVSSSTFKANVDLL